MILLIGIVVCFALGIYFEAYSYKNIPGYGSLGRYNLNYNGINPGAGGIGINPYANPLYAQQAQQQLLLNNGGIGATGFGGYGGYGRYYGDYICNPSGQAYCAILGIDIIVLIIALIGAGVASRKDQDYRAAGEPPQVHVQYKA